MKLYISYYGNYVSIVEGSYNSKKDKYIIKKSIALSSHDVHHDENDKYALLKEALRLEKWKTKDVVLCLNTRDVLIKPNNIDELNPKDLDGIMNNEMYEMMSLNEDQYTFSYEVVKERSENDKKSLDVIIAAIMTEELYTILGIFKEFKLNVERIDTMATAFSRLLKKIEYDNIMMLNIGEYGSMVNIYKDDSLFIYDNIPVKINSEYSGGSSAISLALVDEVKGLMNFYSSRNYGNAIDTIVIVGQSNENENILESFEYSFDSDIVRGIENLFDIEDDIQGDLQVNEISKFCDILGSMSIINDKKSYSFMNLLPLKQRIKQDKSNTIKRYISAAPIALGIMSAPYFIFGAMNMKVLNDTVLAQSKLEEITREYKGIEDINDKIKLAKEEIEIYDMLSSKKITWEDLLSSIDKNVPYRVDITNISAVYEEPSIDVSDDETQQENSNSQKDESEVLDETSEIPIYEKIPNTMNIEGLAKNSSYVGQFLYNLNKLSFFNSVKLLSSVEDEESGMQVFSIVLELKEGAISGE